ncbi:MFS transporter [Bauldia litoralis]|nr:MFS transporter [Bauldia litoralis]
MSELQDSGRAGISRLTPPRWLNRRTMTWASYDFAASTYFGVIPVLIFPIFFATVVAPGPSGDLYWGLSVAGAYVVSGLAAPLLGVLADRTRSRLPLMAAATLACCLATAATAAVAPGQVAAAVVICAVAQTGYFLAMSLYESYLPGITTPADSGRVSCFAWSIGFVGGGVALLAVLFIVRTGPSPGAMTSSGFQTSFIVVALMFALFALPALVGLRRIAVPRSASEPILPVLDLMRSWRMHRQVFTLILAACLINSGIVTVLVFSTKFFASNFGASIDRLLVLLLVFHLIAVPATWGFGELADRWSHTRAIIASLVIWAAGILLMILGRGEWVPVIVVVLLATVVGSTQALLRSLLARMVPIGRAAEFFGFSTLSGRASAALGPLTYGAISAATGSERIALVSVFVFMAAGAVVITRLRFEDAAAPHHA